MSRLFVTTAFLLLWSVAPAWADDAEPSATAAVDDETCLACHDDRDIEAETERGKKLALYVAEGALADTSHEGLSCTDCHVNAQTFEEAPHNDGRPVALGCDACHAATAEEYQRSVHGRLQLEGDTTAARCADCHGGHAIYPASDRRSSVNAFRLSVTCAACHQDGVMLETHQVGDQEAVVHYVDSIHGRALLVDGLAVAPTCNDCHGVHDILPHENPRSRISKDHVPGTCGKCHVLVEEIYEESVHGKLLAAGDLRGPTCVDCHTSHEITAPRRPEFRASIDHKCGACHEDRLARYRETFHGKAIALGRAGVAACFDCHGHHDIQPTSDPRSPINAANRLATCQTCHPSAGGDFAGYMVHADHTDRENSPTLYWVYVFMTALLLGTFLFFAAHSLLWLLRSAALFLRDSRTFREEKERARLDEEEYIRFKPVDRFLHGLVVFSFLLLVVTGMPLKFYYTGWAKLFLDLMGGQAVAATLHRVGAVITIFYMVVHTGTLAMSLWRNRSIFRAPETGRNSWRRIFAVIFGPDSPMPNLQDLRDFWAHQKWFFGRGQKPQFDRWTYWEKFDYFAVFWGVMVIGGSGLVMWFPELFTRFLPGWVVNVSLVIHSDEALLAAGFIFTFHFFNVHFRPEKFPMDPVIFSGRVSRTELLLERRRLFDRWQSDGELEAHKVKDEWRAWRRIALPAGFIAFLIGVAMVVLIYAAMYARLVE